MLARSATALMTLALAAACARHLPPQAAAEPVDEEENAPPPPEPVGPDCMTPASVEKNIAQLRRGMEDPEHPREPSLVIAMCQKRVYRMGKVRFVFWNAGRGIEGKVSSHARPAPSALCIDRGLAQVRSLTPIADRILTREIARDPGLWRDPDVGAVAYFECDAGDQPSFSSLDTMLHETNHLVSFQCSYDPMADREMCLVFDTAPLPPGTIAAYAQPPGALDAESLTWFDHVQRRYLVDNGQGIRELLDEVMAYSVTSEVFAAGAVRKLYPGPHDKPYNNLPLLMALCVRYLDELAIREPTRFGREFGAKGRNRAAVLAIFDRGEVSYRTWLQAMGTPGVFERVFWDDYLRTRQQWLQR